MYVDVCMYVCMYVRLVFSFLLRYDFPPTYTHTFEHFIILYHSYCIPLLLAFCMWKAVFVPMKFCARVCPAARSFRLHTLWSVSHECAAHDRYQCMIDAPFRHAFHIFTFLIGTTSGANYLATVTNNPATPEQLFQVEGIGYSTIFKFQTTCQLTEVKILHQS